MEQVNELEAAILQRADRLAAEYRARAERSRDNILREAQERLRLREEREVLLAKARAERAYRRKVQASELKLHKEMDRLLWNLVEGVRDGLSERVQALSLDDDKYLPLLKAMIGKAATAIERDELVAELNARDLKRLQPEWEDFIRDCASGKQIVLSSTPIESQGGVLLRSSDNRIHLDNTFEGRIERLKSRLQQVITERLLPGGRDNGILTT